MAPRTASARFDDVLRMLKLFAIGHRTLGVMRTWRNADEAKGGTRAEPPRVGTQGRWYVMRRMAGFAALNPLYKAASRAPTP